MKDDAWDPQALKGLNRKLTRKERILNKVQPSVKSEAEKNFACDLASGEK